MLNFLFSVHSKKMYIIIAGFFHKLVCFNYTVRNQLKKCYAYMHAHTKHKTISHTVTIVHKFSMNSLRTKPLVSSKDAMS